MYISSSLYWLLAFMSVNIQNDVEHRYSLSVFLKPYFLKMLTVLHLHQQFQVRSILLQNDIHYKTDEHWT